MQLLPSSFDPAPRAAVVCRRGRAGLLVLAAVLWAIPAFWWWLGAPWPIPFLCAALALLLTPLMGSTWRHRGRPGNWALALGPEGVWLNLRSGDHTYGAESLSVLRLDHGEIREAVRHVRHVSAPDGDGGSARNRRTSLELRLFRPLPVEVAGAIDRVRNEKLPTKTYLGGIRVTSRVTSFPVEVAGDDALRVLWSDRGQALHPRIGTVLETLARHLGTGAPAVVETTDWRALDEAAFENYLTDLARSGQEIAAVSAARQRLDLPLVEARDLVQRLTVGP